MSVIARMNGTTGSFQLNKEGDSYEVAWVAHDDLIRHFRPMTKEITIQAIGLDVLYELVGELHDIIEQAVAAELTRIHEEAKVLFDT